MNNQQEGRPTALITGGSYGVGAATALALARSGHNIAVTATKRGNLDKTKAAVEAVGARVAAIELDLTRQASIEAAVDRAIADLGRVDVLVNNAGTHGRKPAIDITRADWDAIFEPNLAGTFFLTQRFGRHLIEAKRPGSIVSITSTHAVRGAPVRLMYGVSKAAIHQVTRMLAIEWAPHGIRVNAVAPGRMMTDSPSRQETGQDPNYIEAMRKKIPLQRLPTAEDCAAAVDFLCSPGAASITGHILMIDGGLTVQGSTS
jgi:NAD(P)-dependent dehydrogenase (short-subunit alcohol dehydrogenase family)